MSRDGGDPWTVYGTKFSANGFSAQHGAEVYIGLADADTVHSIEVTWPDGVVDLHTDVQDVLNGRIRFER